MDEHMERVLVRIAVMNSLSAWQGCHAQLTEYLGDGKFSMLAVLDAPDHDDLRMYFDNIRYKSGEVWVEYQPDRDDMLVKYKLEDGQYNYGPYPPVWEDAP